MKKLKKLSLKQLEDEMPVMGGDEQRGFVGGSGGMVLSTQGLNLIKSFEGLSLVEYDDNGEAPGANMTIGYGHVTQSDEFFGSGITESYALELLACDVEWAVNHVNNVVSADLNQGQFDALVSYVFNTGYLSNSQLLQKLNQGDYYGAACEMDIFTSGG